MNNKLLFILIVVILFAVGLSSCNKISNQSTSSKKAESATQKAESSKAESIAVLEGQDVSDITKLKTPDELVYLHDGSETVFNSDNPKFQKIIQLNSTRQTNQLDVLKLFIDYNDVANYGDYLIYKYTKSNYAAIYFKLAPSPDGDFINWVVNYYGSKLIPGYAQNYDQSKIEAYGYLAPADELLTYLKN
ncbi:hypothetical protein V7111_16365 [Neobacillus niacini]|uniref:hypothetical protein n=1 Tax=Neobacillus niacini TaxID=86668 RepID=UPI003002A3D0